MNRQAHHAATAVVAMVVAALAGCGGPSVKLARGPVMLDRGSDFQNTVGLRRQEILLASQSDALFVTAKPVELTANTETGGYCPHDSPVFYQGEKFLISDNGTTKHLQLAGKDIGVLVAGTHTKNGVKYVTWLQTYPPLPKQVPPATAYDYYVMLVDVSPTSMRIRKHYRIEAFPASGWTKDSSCVSWTCDCERPDATGAIIDDMTAMPGKPIGESHSGEGDELN